MAADPQYEWFRDEHGLRAINHVFMPRRLPGTFDSEEADKPELCLSTMLDCICEIPNFASMNCIPLTKRMLRNWAACQRSFLDMARVKDAILNMEPSDQLAFYLVAQNATIVVRQQEGQVRLWGFDVHAKTATLTKAPQTLCGVFPRAAVMASPGVVLTTDFAEQLIALHRHSFIDAQRTSVKHGTVMIETRDATKPKYVFDWLLSAVATEVDQTAPRLVKKVRDAVVYDKGALPWRRSGIFLSLKWVLHASLVSELGHVSGTCLFKACMLIFACRLAEEQHLNVDMDLRQQMMAKCARKLSKLELLLEKEHQDCTNTLLKQIYLHVTSSSHRTLSILYEKSKNLWRDYQETWRKESNWVLKPGDLNFQTDVEQKLPNSKEVLLNLINREAVTNQVSEERAVATFSMSWEIPDNRLWILHHEEEDSFRCFMNLTINSSIESLCNALDTYVTRAEIYYRDPYGWSRKILCVYCKVAVIDYRLCQEFPIAKEHASDIDPSLLRHLVVVDSKLLQVLEKVEDYFRNRNALAKYPGPQEVQVSPSSFAVRFAEFNYSMEETRKAIVEESNQQERAKREEIRRDKETIERLRKLADRSEHEYNRILNSNYVYERVHVSACKRCGYERQIQNLSAQLFEHLLPERLDYQRAIVFELTSPKNVNLWWDAIVLANRVVQDWKVRDLEIHLRWSTTPTLTKWNRGHSRTVQLVSTRKSFLQTHYRSKAVQYATEDDFIVENASNCVYTGDELYAAEGQGKVQRKCTYALQKESYKPLQSYMGFTHQESQVLAAQYRCSSAMKLSEFGSFGCLRAGQRLQWHNLFAAFHQRTLSFGQKDVMQLVCQIAWQACEVTDTFPREELKWMRNLHAVLLREGFVQEFIEELESYLMTIEKNWQNHWALGAVVVLTVRIFDVLGTLKLQGSLAELNLSYVVKFLRRCRSLGTEWLGTIEAIVKDADKMDLEDLAALRRRLVEIASFIGLSYNTHTSLVSELLTDQVDILHWLRAVICIRDNTVLVNTEIPGFSGSLLQLVQRVAFQMKGRLAELSSPEVFDVCVANYYAAGAVISSGFSLVTENALWAQFHWTQKTASRGVANTPALIQINLLQGDFWIDGSPLGRLHKEITSNAIYTRLFEETVFDVVVCTDTFGARARRTKYEYSGSRFVFTQDRIDEERADGQVLHLIPDHYFRDDLPVSFSQDFSHWLCIRTKMLYFREKGFRHPKFADLHQAEFVLNCSSFVLTNKEGQMLIDTNSPTARKLAAIFERLEPRPFLHIWCPNIAEELLLVRLTRHGLDFSVASCTGIISSVEHVGWVVSADQSLGTLFGLRHVLLLESGSAAARKMALIPHGKLVLSSRGTNPSHHHLDIGLGDIQSPSYFSYKVDSNLRCLTGPANQTAWLYLAALHAGTSSVLRDEFTGMTGLEMAFYILQSPRCWSSRPYDATAYEILNFVSDLAPKRNYYPQHLQAMEQVIFPSVIPSLCAHEGYYFLAQKLIGDSKRLHFLYSDERNKNECQEGHDLSVKYYYDSLKNYSPLAHLDGEFKPVVKVSEEGFAYRKIWQEHSKVRYVSTAVRENMVLNFEFTKESLWDSIVRNSVKYEPKDMVDSKNMQSCASWETVCVPDMFFALDKHIREYWTEVNHRSFLLSFLAFTKPALHGALAALTVASYSSSTNIPSKGLLPPSFLSYCTKMPLLDTASFYQIYCFRDFCTNSGLVRKDEEAVNRYRRNYNQTADSLKTSVDSIVTQEKFKMERFDTNSNTAREFRTTETLTCNYDDIVNVREVNSKIADAFCKAHQYRVLKAYCAAVSEERQKHLPFATLNLSSTEDHSRPLLHLKSEYPILKFTLSHPDVVRQSSLKKQKMEDLVDFMENRATVDSGNEPSTHLPLTIHGDDPVSQIFLQNLKDSYVNLKPKRRKLSKDSESIQRSLNCQQRLLNSSLCLLESRYSDSLQVPGTKCLHMIELSYPCLPLVFFPRLLQSDCGQLSSWIAEIATLWTKVQKCERLLLHLDQGNSDAFQKELRNGLHSNWKVATMPEWLFFELENDVSIWPVQVEVAEKMMNPDGNQHSVLQLNMGEGKTSIITPMIAAKLANGQQLLRIIVLTSLFSTNFEELALKLGGLLRKRIYIFPCRRDIQIHVQDGQRILRVLEECQRLGGVILTVPEHVLSLQLKYFETCMKGDEHLASILGTILTYLHVNARDVIDEADEVLNHKYQLIYTLGGQAFPDGGQFRYSVPQVCFHLVKKHLTLLQQKYRSGTVECVSKAEPQAFPALRLLESPELADAYRWLCDHILEDFMSGTTGSDLPWRSLTPRQEEVLRKFIQTRDLEEGMLNKF